MRAKIILFYSSDTHRKVCESFLEDHKAKRHRKGYYIVKGGKYKVERILNVLHIRVGQNGSVRSYK